jgi:hypothetical protein
VYRRNDTVHPDDVLQMVDLSSTQRLEWIAQEHAASRPHVKAVIERFLTDTDKSEDQLVAEFLDRDIAKAYLRRANELGDTVYDLLVAVGEDSPFFRLMVV